MFNFRCIFRNSVSSVYRQVSASLNGNGTSLVGRGGVPLQRPLHCSAVALQEAESTSKENSGDEFSAVTLQEAESTSKEDSGDEFSYLPPLPGEDSPLRWDEKKFEELPILHIKATYNNTHIQLIDCAGQFMVKTSCGTEGFKNAKKSTPIAAQTAGISAATKATAKGVKFVRVVVKGLGHGRLPAIQGLKMGGLEVVSITDNTPVPHNGCRPRKARRI